MWKLGETALKEPIGLLEAFDQFRPLRGTGRAPAVSQDGASASSAWSLLAAAIPVFYAYGGYQNAMNLAGDVKRARRGLPLAILGGMGIVVALYLLVNAAYQRAGCLFRA